MRVLIVDPGLRHAEKERNPEGPLSFFFTPEPSGIADFDLVVLPVGVVLERSGSPDAGVPRMAYGPADLAADAFAEGCLDYLREPWTLEELEARALRFRVVRFRLGGRDYAYASGRLDGAEGSLSLPEGERRVLELLLGRLGRDVPRAALRRALGPEDPRESRRLDMTVSRLRSRLVRASGDPRAGSFLQAVRNRGYRLSGKPCA